MMIKKQTCSFAFLTHAIFFISFYSSLPNAFEYSIELYECKKIQRVIWLRTFQVFKVSIFLTSLHIHALDVLRCTMLTFRCKWICSKMIANNCSFAEISVMRKSTLNPLKTLSRPECHKIMQFFINNSRIL